MPLGRSKDEERRAVLAFASDGCAKLAFDALRDPIGLIRFDSCGEVTVPFLSSFDAASSFLRSKDRDRRFDDLRCSGLSCSEPEHTGFTTGMDSLDLVRRRILRDVGSL